MRLLMALVLFMLTASCAPQLAGRWSCDYTDGTSELMTITGFKQGQWKITQIEKDSVG